MRTTRSDTRTARRDPIPCGQGPGVSRRSSRRGLPSGSISSFHNRWTAGSSGTPAPPDCELVTLTSPEPCAQQLHVLAGYLESDSSFVIRRAAEVAAGFIKQVAGANMDSIDLGRTTADLTFRAKELAGRIRYEARGQRLYPVLVFSPSAQPVAWGHLVDGLRVTGARGATVFPATYPDGDPLRLRGRGKRFRDLHDPASFARRRPKAAVIDGSCRCWVWRRC